MQYQNNAAEKEFTINVDIANTTIEYGNMTGQSTSLVDQNIFYNIAQDPNINSPENIFRPEDPSFGIKIRPEVLLLAGLEAQTLTAFQNQMEQNHANKTLFFGDLKTAVAKENDLMPCSLRSRGILLATIPILFVGSRAAMRSDFS